MMEALAETRVSHKPSNCSHVNFERFLMFSGKLLSLLLLRSNTSKDNKSPIDADNALYSSVRL